MFDADDMRWAMKAAIEYERHGTLPADTMMALDEIACCAECAMADIEAMSQEAL